MNIRRFVESDADTVSELIRATIRISNTKDSPVELMDALIETERLILRRDYSCNCSWRFWASVSSNLNIWVTVYNPSSVHLFLYII
jgi:hypothetical protein